MSKSEEVTLNGSPKLDRYHLAEEGAVSSDPADPRITENTRATLHELDNSYGHQLSDYIHHHHHHTEEKTSDADLAKQVSTATEDEVLEKQDGPIYVRIPKTYFFSWSQTQDHTRSTLKRATRETHSTFQLHANGLFPCAQSSSRGYRVRQLIRL